jgi:hypothetical protein
VDLELRWWLGSQDAKTRLRGEKKGGYLYFCFLACLLAVVVSNIMTSKSLSSPTAMVERKKQAKCHHHQQ